MPFIHPKTESGFDIVSDLHIDQWDSSLNIKNPCGEVLDYPFKFKEQPSKILIIAGDISDDIDLSIKYLNEISNNYEKILFVDGNHEHVSSYPKLLSNKEIDDKIRQCNNPKIVYLPENDFIVGKTVFLGMCGWWDYDNRNSDSIKNALAYFDEWIPEIASADGGSLKFIDNVTNKSEEQHRDLIKKLEYYEGNSDIENIVIVTHTVPLEEFALEADGNTETSCQLQSFSKDLVDGRYKKLKTWIFGHTHNQFDKTINNVRFLTNPRGRPEDFNRINYELKSIY